MPRNAQCLINVAGFENIVLTEFFPYSAYCALILTKSEGNMKNLIYVLAFGLSAFMTAPLSGQSPPPHPGRCLRR